MILKMLQEGTITVDEAEASSEQWKSSEDVKHGSG